MSTENKTTKLGKPYRRKKSVWKAHLRKLKKKLQRKKSKAVRNNDKKVVRKTVKHAVRSDAYNAETLIARMHSQGIVVDYSDLPVRKSKMKKVKISGGSVEMPRNELKRRNAPVKGPDQAAPKPMRDRTWNRGTAKRPSRSADRSKAALNQPPRQKDTLSYEQFVVGKLEAFSERMEFADPGSVKINRQNPDRIENRKAKKVKKAYVEKEYISKAERARLKELAGKPIHNLKKKVEGKS